MPEGDTVLRTANRLEAWLAGRTITDAQSQRVKVPATALVGQTVERVEANGKHLLIRLSSGRALHTHLRMTGSWHLYRAGERWRKPAHLARVVLTAGDRVAVCFEAPVVELLDAAAEGAHPSLSRLGPDVMVEPLDLEEVVCRARSAAPETPIGAVLLDQQVVAGIGNIFRCESLFRARLDPFIPVADLDDEAIRGVVTGASRLMRASAAARSRPWVYGRAGRPCRRCRTRIESAPLGSPPRTVVWCPRCQGRLAH